MRQHALVINERDNVAIVVEELPAGTKINFVVGNECNTVLLLQDIPLGHKVAIRNISRGEKIVKYGESIGLAVKNILAGQHVHVHNLESQRGRGDIINGIGERV